MADILKRGDFVHVTFQGRTVRAMVTIASPDARSLMIMFDGMLGGFVGMMPLLWREARPGLEAGYVDLIQHAPAVVTPMCEDAS
jgi:hypothetical protein